MRKVQLLVSFTKVIVLLPEAETPEFDMAQSAAKQGEGENGELGLGAGEQSGHGIRDDLNFESQRSASKV